MEQPSAHETARLFCSLRWFWISRGQFSEAERWAEGALAQARRTKELSPLAEILDAAGWIRYMAGDPAKAHEFSTEAYRLFMELGDQRGTASAGIISGIAKVTLGEDLETGLELISGSMELFRSLGDDYGTVVALIAFGEGARSEGDENTAEQYYQEALLLLGGLGDTYWPGHLLQNLAHFRLHQGEWREAAKLASEALAISERYDYPMVVNLATAAVSGVFLAKGATYEAAWIIGAIQARLERLGVRFEPTDDADFQRIVLSTRQTLGEEQFASAASEGSTAEWEDVLSLARSCESGGVASPSEEEMKPARA
jgi:tetratricopeptide (TPR) repeat protein